VDSGRNNRSITDINSRTETLNSRDANNIRDTNREANTNRDATNSMDANNSCLSGNLRKIIRTEKIREKRCKRAKIAHF
jgi:hypothetical protein